MLDQENIKLRTFANKPTIYKDLVIKPKTLSQIIEIGYNEFNQNLNLVCLSKSDVFPGVDFGEYQVTLLECLLHANDPELVTLYLNAFSFFLDSTLSIQEGTLAINESRYSFGDLEFLTEIIKIQNNVVVKQKDNFNPLNNRARKLKERILARQEKIKKLKKGNQGNNEDLSFEDLISICASKCNGINIFNVFDLNYYQFNDQFNRTKIIDDYQVNIQALLHGADSKDIELKHWISKLE